MALVGGGASGSLVAAHLLRTFPERTRLVLIDRYGRHGRGQAYSTPDSHHLLNAVAALPSAVTSWSATGIGRSHLSGALAALSKGGHLRVGLEDVLTLAKGVPVEHTAQLVERVVTLGEIAQRPVMTPDEARDLLQIKRR